MTNIDRILSYSSHQILGFKHPYELFQIGRIEICDRMVKELQNKWHPDKNKDSDATAVSSHINHLHQRAKAGDWGNVIFLDEVGTKKTYSIKYVKSDQNDCGQVFVCKKLVAFLYPEENKDLYQNYIGSVRSILFPNEDFKKNFYRMIPREVMPYHTNGGYLITVYKGIDQIRLSDLLMKRCLTEDQVSWIITGLFNFCLFMDKVEKKSFNGLTTENLFINPVYRTIHPIAGWEFVRPHGENLIALPQKLISLLPSRILDQKKSSSEIDAISIRLIGLTCLGDSTGTGSGLSNTPLVSFLRSLPSSDLLEDYSQWCKVERQLNIADIPARFSNVYDVIL